MTATESYPFPASPGSRAAAGVLRLIASLVVAAGVLLLAATAYLLARESTWLPLPLDHADETESQRNERAFFHGTIGTEVVPLPVIKVMPQLCKNPNGSPSHFFPFDGKGDNWASQFGFLPASLAPASARPDPSAEGLPLGFTVSHYRPKSGAPSPVAFVGFACATCHTTRINNKLVVGTGNSALNLFAWIDAFQAALGDQRVEYDFIVREYESDKSNPPLSLEEKGMIRLWLRGARDKMNADAARFGDPFGNGLSMLPEFVPTGPCRTQPFRTLVRTLVDRPGADMKVYTKIAAIYKEEPCEWGQFDGSIHGLYRRSAAAALAAGATPQNMTLPEIANNIRWASDFISASPGPRWQEIFPDQHLDENAAGRGKALYLAHCDSCHGHPEVRGWVKGKRDGEIISLAEIGTDPQRVTFRYYDEIPDRLAGYFPKNHPFDFPRKDLRPEPQLDPSVPAKTGFINKRMHAMFSRAPLLHNGSVLTLSELINREERESRFYRGASDYDVKRVGLSAPQDAKAVAKNPNYYFLFDTEVVGNSNKGHDYPWKRAEVSADEKKKSQLDDLLEYLKSL